MSVAFVWEQHDEPHDYFRPTREGLNILLKKSGFKVVKLENIGNSWTTLGQVLNFNLVNLVGRKRFFTYILYPLLIANSIGFYYLGRLLETNYSKRLPLGFFVVAKKI